MLRPALKNHLSANKFAWQPFSAEIEFPQQGYYEVNEKLKCCW